MLRESLPEMLMVAKYCIEFRKDTSIWPAPGCYGYPAALILLSIVDSIGSYVEKGNVENHFKILNNNDYYNLKLSAEVLRAIYDYYRNSLSHNSVLTPGVILNIGQQEDDMIQKIDDTYVLSLIPFYGLSVHAVNQLLNHPTVLQNNQTIKNINKKK